VMNVVWMAVLGMVMTIEKIGATTRFSRALGVLFIMVGAAFIVTAVVAHWPGTL
jgi:predicted metal-binding membrane protein